MSRHMFGGVKMSCSIPRTPYLLLSSSVVLVASCACWFVAIVPGAMHIVNVIIKWEDYLRLLQYNLKSSAGQLKLNCVLGVPTEQ